MYDQIQRMTREMDTIVETLHSVHGQQRNLQESLRDHQRTVYSKLEGFCQSQAFTGELADAFFEHHRRIAAQARLALQNLGDHADVVHHHMQLLQHTREHFSTQMTQVMYRIPPEVWWFLGDRVCLPTMDEMLLGDAGEHLLSVWDRFVPAQMPHHDQNPLTGLIEWAGDEIHGAIASLFNTITSWGMHLEEVRDIVGWAGNIVQELQQSLYQHHQSFTMAALSCPCSSPLSKNPFVPPPQTLHAKADLQRRAILFYSYLHMYDASHQPKVRLDLLLKELDGLNPDDVQELEYLYFQDYHQSLNHEINSANNLTVYDRFALYQRLAPQTLTFQQSDAFSPSGDTHVMMPVNMLTTVIPAGTYPQFQIWDAAQQTVVQSTAMTVFFVPSADAIRHGAPPLIAPLLGTNGGNTPANGLQWPGTYTAYVEVPPSPGKQNAMPRYIAYTIRVAPPQAIGIGTIMFVESLGGQTQGLWPSSVNAYLTLLQSKDARDASNVQLLHIPSNALSLHVLLTADHGPSQTIPLTVFAAQEGNQWKIYDVSDPSHPHVYTGATLQRAWEGDGSLADQSFIKTNRYPEKYVLTAHLVDPLTQQSLLTYNAPNTVHSVKVTAIDWGERLTSILFTASLLTGDPVFGVAGAILGIGTVIAHLSLNADQTPNWNWQDPSNFDLYAEGASDLFFGLLEGGNLASKLLALKVTAETTETTTRLTFWVKATQTIVVNGKVIENGATIGLVLSNATPLLLDYLQRSQSRFTPQQWARLMAEYQAGNWQGLLSDLSTLNADFLTDFLATIREAGVAGTLPVFLLMIPLAGDSFGFKRIAETFNLDSADPETITAFFDTLQNTPATDPLWDAYAKQTGLPKDLIQCIAGSPQLQGALGVLGKDQLTALYSEYAAVSQGEPSLEGFQSYLLDNADTFPILAHVLEGTHISGRDSVRLGNTDIVNFGEIPGLSSQQIADYVQQIVPEQHLATVNHITYSPFNERFEIDPTLDGYFSVELGRTAFIRPYESFAKYGLKQLQKFEGVIIHEIAHGVQTDLFARYPNLEQEWIALYEDDEEGSASEYAKTNWQEDFAESYRIFLTAPNKLQMASPKKYAFMKNIVFNIQQYWR